MSPINPACDACAADLTVPVYRPLQSRRGVDVFVCPLCGLTQSLFQSYHSEARQTLSADADWGNVRHGKSLRFEALTQILNKIDWSQITYVLDVGSNRGDFVLWVMAHHPNINISAIEPDEKIVDYQNINGLKFENKKLEDFDIPNHGFDFIYSCQTLEHAASAAGMLQKIWMSMRPGAHFLVDIPNIQSIGLNDIVEEFFIDKHVFHFDPTTIRALVESIGFEVVWQSDPSELFNITLLLRKIEQKLDYLTFFQNRSVVNNIDLIKMYERNLQNNRTLLVNFVEKKLRPLAKRQKVAYWGAGRIFDALVKYGGLTPSDVHLLVDKYLSKVIDQAHGIEIHRPEQLRMSEPQVLVVLARSGESAIAARAYAMGIRHVLKFSELLEQVANAADAPPVGRPRSLGPSENIM